MAELDAICLQETPVYAVMQLLEGRKLVNTRRKITVTVSRSVKEIVQVNSCHLPFFISYIFIQIALLDESNFTLGSSATTLLILIEIAGLKLAEVHPILEKVTST